MPPTSRARRGKRALVAIPGLALVATSVTLIATPAAQAADPVTINLLNINDFHGRIDANTTKFATTIEQLRAEAGEDSTLFLSAGDNIGASLFASSVAEDKPTIDVLNALELSTSAVGNHEFDKGWDDLSGRVAEASEFSYLGANVYEKGTTTPVLDEFDTFEVNGVTVGVIGVVTQETPSLVTPSGIENLDFGDPVEAVNRVAGELTDGDDTNGEADVLVAEYHEGAGANLPDTATCEEEIAADTTFGRIARETVAAVDVIFTGHTHKMYACDGPVPGAAGETRPILQTGSYGENIGQVELSVDPETGEVVSYTQGNVARAAAEDLTLPRVAAVKEITDAATAYAAEVGNEPVGSITADITTAFAGESRDDRASESTLGDLVGNALRDGLPASAGEADLGIVNPGGLRNELYFEGDTSSNPANTDGVVTFGEANAVLPFVNNVYLVDLTGAELATVLEQQWQTDAEGNIPSRPYLQLGLSDNVRVTADPSKPLGERITSVWIDGAPLDPSATYTVSTFSFLATGGDNFRAFTEGTARDTGLVDRDLWISYLENNPNLSPDFARQMVEETGMPASVSAGDAVSFSLSKLDLTSLGSPANTAVTAYLTQGAETVVVGDFPVTDGSTTVEFTAPADLEGAWQVGVIADPSDTQVGAPIVKASSRVIAKASPKKVVAKKTRATVRVTVTAGGENASGKVTVRVAGKSYDATLKNGKAAVKLVKFPKPGTRTATVRYLGDDFTMKSSDKVTIKVVKKKNTKK